MRISDWSSDVCSSDLPGRLRDLRPACVVRLRSGLDAGDARGQRLRPRLRNRRLVQPARPRVRPEFALGAGALSHRAAAPPLLWERLEPRAFSRTIAASMPREGTARIEIGRAQAEEHTSELQSLMRISYAVFCVKKKKKK